VNDLVDQYAADLVGATVLTVYDVLAREVNLLGRFRACGIRYALHGSKDEQYGLHAAKHGVGDQRRYPAVLAATITHFFGALSVVV
jgi:hypothetical protein